MSKKSPQRGTEAHRGPILRLATAGDAAGVAAVYAPYVLETAITFETVPPTIEEMRGRIERIGATHAWLVCVEGDTLLGYAYSCPHRERPAYRWATDCTVYVARGAHRRGIGRALYTALFPITAARGYVVSYAGITLPNANSVGLHEALGFKPLCVYPGVGFKHGAWHDVGWWSLELAPRGAEPAEPHAAPDDVIAAALRAGRMLVDRRQ